MSDKIKILLIQDSATSEKRIVKHLQDNSIEFDYLRIQTVSEMDYQLTSENWDIILCDYVMPDFSAPEAIKLLKVLEMDIPLIVLSGATSTNDELEIITQGAEDLIFKDNLIRLVPVIKREINKKKNLESLNSDIEKTSVFSTKLEERIIERTKELISVNKLLKNHIKDNEAINRELVKAKNFLNTILQNIPIMIYTKDVETLKYTYCNIASKSILGIEPQDLIGQDNSAILLPEDVEYYKEIDKAVFKDGFFEDISGKTIQTKNNEHKTVLTKKFLIQDENQNPLHILGIVQDITLNRELHIRESLFTKIFELNPAPTVIWSQKDFRIIEYNQSFMNLFELDKDNKRILHFDEVIKTHSVDYDEELLDNLIKQDELSNIDIVLISNDNQKKHISMSFERFIYDNDQLFITILFDFTKQKIADEEMRIAFQQQQELNLLRTQFISMISHEYRTPLTAIMLSADILKRYGDLWEKHEKDRQFQLIQDSVLKMTQLMENVLIIDKMDSGYLQFHPDKVDFDAFCLSIINSILMNSDNSHFIKYSYNIESRLIILDENIIGLIITNIVGNSIKYSAPGTTIDFDIDENPNDYIITISDNGRGILKEDLDLVTKPFYRGKNTASIAGFGLGLAIVSNCLNTITGRIEIQSEIKVGTTVKVFFPKLSSDDIKYDIL